MYTRICKGCSVEFTMERNSRNRRYCFKCVPLKAKHYLTTPEGYRICFACKETKSLNEFSKRGQSPSGRSWECKKCASIRMVKVQKLKKQKCIDYKGSRCQICGYDKCQSSLHFHHIDPSQKDFTIAKHAYRSFERIKAELDKCVLVCSNCHSEVHDGITECPSPLPLL